MSYERYTLLIDSSKRQNQNEINTNFSVNLTNGYKVKMARLKNACIPLTYYNITSSNNTITYICLDSSDGAHTFSATLTPGCYNVYDLQSQINTLLQQNDATYGSLSITFNQYNCTYTLTASNFIPGQFGIYIVPSQLMTDLGFINNSPGDFIAKPTLTSNSPTKFINTDYLKLSITYLDSNVINIDNNQTNTTFFLELPNNDGTDVYYGKNLYMANFADDTGAKNNIYTTPVSLQSFKVSLTDRYDNILNLNGVNWWAIIELIVVISNDNYTPPPLQNVIPSNNASEPDYLLDAKKNNNIKNLPPWMQF